MPFLPCFSLFKNVYLSTYYNIVYNNAKVRNRLHFYSPDYISICNELHETCLFVCLFVFWLFVFLTSIWLPHGQLWATYWADSPTHPMLSTALFIDNFQPEGHREPRNEVGSDCLAGFEGGSDMILAVWYYFRVA